MLANARKDHSSPLLHWILESTLSRVDLSLERFVSSEKCHISASLVCHNEKIKLDEGKIGSLSFDRFPFYYTFIFPILQPLESGYHEIKVNELLDWAWN